MLIKILIQALLFFLFGLAALHSNPSRAPVILILLHSSDATETPSLRSVIIQAITAELESRSATAVSTDETATGTSAILAFAQKKKADFAISGTYSLSGREVLLSLAWFDVGLGKSYPEISSEGSLDLSFDVVVSRLVGDLLAGQEQRLASLPPLPPPEPPAVEQKPAPEAPATTVPVSPVTRVSRVAFTLGSAPFIPVFKASAYIPGIGLSLSAEGEYRFPLRSGLLGIALETGLHLFYAEKASTADAFAVPIAAGVVYRTATGSFVDFVVRVQGGPSIFIMVPAGGGTSVGVVPYVSSGLGLTMNFSTFLAASVSLDYVAIMVPDAIMGFAPTVTLDMRL